MMVSPVFFYKVVALSIIDFGMFSYSGIVGGTM